MRALALVALVLGTSGCVLPAVDLTGRPCPCGPGWVCASSVCVPAGQLDAAIDASPTTDAAAIDAGADGSSDAGTIAIDATTDAGTIPPDAGTDAGTIMPDGGPGPTRCDDLHAGAIFCDGFEFDYPATRGPWGFDLLTTGTVDTVATPTPQIGIGALRAATSAAGGRAAMGVDITPEITGGELWLRAFYHLPSALTVTGLSILYVGTADGSQGISFQIYDGGLASVWVGTALGGDGEWHGTSALVPRATWACLELHVVVDEVAGQVELFLDDTMVGSFAPLDTAPVAAGGFAIVEAGIEYSAAAQVASTLFVDEVVLSRTRVGCD